MTHSPNNTPNSFPSGAVEIGHPALQMTFHSGSGLAAVACNNLGIHMYDVEVSKRDGALLSPVLISSAFC